MRFSSIFHSIPPARREMPREEPRGAPEEESAMTAAPAQQQQQPQRFAQPPAQELPEDLDARVRLIGEWQLGEG